MEKKSILVLLLDEVTKFSLAKGYKPASLTNFLASMKITKDVS